MSTAEIEVVEAFTSIGMSPDQAMKAAAALNRRDGLTEIVGLRSDLGALKGDVATSKTDVATLKSDVAVLKWMAGFNTALALAILIKLFVH